MYSCGYALNVALNELSREANIVTYRGRHESVLPAPAALIAVFDARPGTIASDTTDLPHPTEVIGVYVPAMEAEIKAGPPGATRHQGDANYLFADGHTEWLRPAAIVRECDGATRPCFVS